MIKAGTSFKTGYQRMRLYFSAFLVTAFLAVSLLASLHHHNSTEEPQTPASLEQCETCLTAKIDTAPPPLLSERLTPQFSAQNTPSFVDEIPLSIQVTRQQARAPPTL